MKERSGGGVILRMIASILKYHQFLENGGARLQLFVPIGHGVRFCLHGGRRHLLLHLWFWRQLLRSPFGRLLWFVPYHHSHAIHPLFYARQVLCRGIEYAHDCEFPKLVGSLADDLVALLKGREV